MQRLTVFFVIIASFMVISGLAQEPVYFSLDCYDRELKVTVKHGENHHQQIRKFEGGLTGEYECSCLRGMLRCSARNIPCWDHQRKRIAQETRGIFKYCPVWKSFYTQACPGPVEKYDCLCAGGRSQLQDCKYIPEGCQDEMFRTYVDVGKPFVQWDQEYQMHVCKCAANNVAKSCRPVTEDENRRLIFGDLPEDVFPIDVVENNNLIQSSTRINETRTTPMTTASTTTTTRHTPRTTTTTTPLTPTRTTKTTTRKATTGFCYNIATSKYVQHGQKLMYRDNGVSQTCTCRYGLQKDCVPANYCKITQARVRFEEGTHYIYEKTPQLVYNCSCERRASKMVTTCRRKKFA